MRWAVLVVLVEAAACRHAPPPELRRSQQGLVTTPPATPAASAAVPEQRIAIDFEAPDARFDEARPPPGSRIRFHHDGQDFRMPLEGSIDARPYVADRPRLTSTLFYGRASQGHSLLLTLPPRSEPVAPDRVELDVYDRDLDRGGVTFDFSHPKYFGFAMYIHPTTALPLKSGVHFAQAWQYNCGRDKDGGWCGVPFTATLDNSDPGASQPLSFRVNASDDGPEHYELVPMTPIVVGAWHRFLFYLEPNSNEQAGTGVVRVWVDGVKVADWSHDWGCNLRPDNRGWGPLSDDWDLRVGMYRTGPGDVDQYIQMSFDNVGVGFTRAAADPG